MRPTLQSWLCGWITQLAWLNSPEYSFWWITISKTKKAHSSHIEFALSLAMNSPRLESHTEFARGGTLAHIPQMRYTLQQRRSRCWQSFLAPRAHQSARRAAGPKSNPPRQMAPSKFEARAKRTGSMLRYFVPFDYVTMCKQGCFADLFVCSGPVP